MDWHRELIDALTTLAPCGYNAAAPIASEPTALAALALFAASEYDACHRAARWLAEIQQWDGSVGVTAADKEPKWPTSLALLAWLTAGGFDAHVARAVKWTLTDRGETGPRQSHIGHDTTIAGWSWAADTHSWLEPTALFVLALKRSGHGAQERCRDGVRMIVDRLLPSGGANYGNTVVLGQPLLAHVQPTGLALLAIADESITDPRVEKSLEYLERELCRHTPAASLAFGTLGLAAHGRRPTEADHWLCAAFERERSGIPSPYKLALLTLAVADTNPMLSPSTV
jgi:hypothetical protein